MSLTLQEFEFIAVIAVYGPKVVKCIDIFFVTRVLIDSSDGERSWSTIGVSDNIIEASWQALSDSVVYGLLHNES